MSRIETTFEVLKAQNKKALIPFIMAGDPDLEASLEILKALPGAGANLIEVGMPFTDPVADGETIQLAGQRALKAGTTLIKTLEMIAKFRKDNSETPIILMGYANPIHIYGFEKFVCDAQKAGVDGLIIVDLPPEEADELSSALEHTHIDLIRLITPTTDEERLQTLLKGASGFLYYVSITGITGAAKASPEIIAPHIQTIKSHTDLPVAIGFGIKTPQDAATMAKIGDAAVVGSALIQALQAQGHPQGQDTQSGAPAHRIDPQPALDLLSQMKAAL